MSVYLTSRPALKFYTDIATSAGMSYLQTKILHFMPKPSFFVLIGAIDIIAHRGILKLSHLSAQKITKEYPDYEKAIPVVCAGIGVGISYLLLPLFYRSIAKSLKQPISNYTPLALCLIINRQFADLAQKILFEEKSL